MNSIYGNSIQTLNSVTKIIQNSLASLLEDYQLSTLWIANTEESALTAVTIHETANEIWLKTNFAGVEINSLDIQLSQETVLIRGKSTVESGVEGYFSPGQFQSLIPFPCPVDPETAQAELKDNVLLLRLLKQGQIKQFKVHLRSFVKM